MSRDGLYTVGLSRRFLVPASRYAKACLLCRIQNETRGAGPMTESARKPEKQVSGARDYQETTACSGRKLPKRRQPGVFGIHQGSEGIQRHLHPRHSLCWLRWLRWPTVVPRTTPNPGIQPCQIRRLLYCVRSTLSDLSDSASLPAHRNGGRRRDGRRPHHAEIPSLIPVRAGSRLLFSSFLPPFFSICSLSSLPPSWTDE